MKTTLLATVTAALAAACGGGGTPPKAVISVSAPIVLEGDAGSSEMVFTISLNSPAGYPVRIRYSTVSTAKAGGGSTGSATGGAACGAGVDYVSISNAELVIPNGGTGATVRLTVCGDTVFEPLETLRLNWTSDDGDAGSVVATILNDDRGGLNGTGVAGSFGRDSRPLTNIDSDGRLGFSLANVANSAPAGGNCIRDNVTGLLWEPQSGTPANLHDAATTYNWAGTAAHVTAVNAANTCGFNNWRLPTTEELASLVDNGRATAPALETVFFTNQASAPYWTGTTYRSGSNADAWFVDFNSGVVASDAKTRALRLRLVSDGGFTNATAAAATCADASRFTEHGDGTVSDKRTGLMWKQCAEGQSGVSCSGTAATLDWAAATARPAAVTGDLGYGDWRLPTRAELSSLTQREQCDATGAAPSIIASVFPNAGIVDYWTGTPDAFNASQAWYVNFFDGQVAPAAKTGVSATKRVRLVRAGQ